MAKITLKNVALPPLLTSMNSQFSTHIGIFLLKWVAKFPFSFIYLLSDFFYVVVFYIVGYRKEVVYTNLKNAFPEKNKKEIKLIARKFYRHFADLMLETIKMREMDEKDFRERMVYKNAEEVNRYFEKGQCVVLLTMHYNNWEWSNSLPLVLNHQILGIYKPLHNAQFDKYMNQSRERMGAEMVSNSHTLRRIIEANENDEAVLTWLAGDQTPPEFHTFWFTFLNQDAMFYPGPAVISKRFNHPVFFQNIEKTGRGKYQSTFELLFEKPEDFSEVEIMKAYIHKMEKKIKEKPEYYLWSHKRWKHKRPVNQPLHS